MTRARDTAGIIGSNTLTIDGSKNIGIGSTTPDAKFDINGNVMVGAAITMSAATGIISATAFYGSGANLTNVISGVDLKQDGSTVGTSITAINFSGATISAPSSGLSTVTIVRQLTIGVRTGAAVTFNIGGSSFDVNGRSGNIAINV